MNKRLVCIIKARGGNTSPVKIKPRNGGTVALIRIELKIGANVWDTTINEM